jgi:hypothetical protein
MCELEYVLKFNGIRDLDWSKVELRRHIFSAPDSWERRRTEADAMHDLESPPSESLTVLPKSAIPGSVQSSNIQEENFFDTLLFQADFILRL